MMSAVVTNPSVTLTCELKLQPNGEWLARIGSFGGYGPTPDEAKLALASAICDVAGAHPLLFPALAPNQLCMHTDNTARITHERV